jgi:transcriptional regulator with XRE-family HTH domain
MSVKIKTFRTQLGMTQRQLAERLQTTQQTVARWEGGKSEIPVPQLKELALILGRSVDEILGVESSPSTWRKTPFAIAENEVPYGTLKLVLSLTEIEYPVDEGARESVLRQLRNICPGEGRDNGKEPWLYFWTLDNKIVFVNLGCTKQVDLIGDDVESMPSYEHPEVYRALEELDDPRFEVGEELRSVCQRIVAEYGDQEKAMRVATHVRVVFLDGKEEWQYMDEEATLDYWLLELNPEEVRPQTFIRVESEGYYRDRFLNLTHVALVEVPTNRFHRLNAPEEID